MTIDPRRALLSAASAALFTFAWPDAVAHSQPAGGPGPESLVGTWVADLERSGDRTPFALTFSKDDTGGLRAAMSAPVINVYDSNLGPVKVEGVRIILGGGLLTLERDASSGTLSGEMPAALVPVHRMPARFSRRDLARKPRAMPDAEQRSPVWTREIGAPVWADVAFANGAVFVGDESGRLRALDSKTGAERWIATTGGRIRSRAVVRGSGAWIQSDDGHVYRFDASTGRETLKVRVNEKTPERLPPGPKSRFDRFASTIAFSNGRGFVGAHDGAVVAFDESTGVRAWSFKAGDAVLSTPAIARGRVYFGSFDHHVYAVDESTGALVWKRDTGAPVVSQPLAHEGLVVVGSRSYDLMGLDASTGAPRWNRYVWFSWIESNVARHGGTGYVGSSDAAKVFAFDLTTGKPVWEADAHGWAWGEPAVTDDRVYVGTSGTPGYLVGHESSILAFDRMTGTVAWWHRLTPPAGKDPYGVTGSLATGDGLVFAGALDGRLLAFRR